MSQILEVSTFHDLVSTTFKGENNAICWERELKGDFSEIVNKLETEENITLVTEKDLRELSLTEQGQNARNLLLNDLELLTNQGAEPILNIIKYYERDDALSFFPTDVYSYHVDRSPVHTYTYLCTYYGESSELIPNSQAIQKILIPEIRLELKKLYDGTEEDFESFLKENFYDLHYDALSNAVPISLGIGNLWRLAVDCPGSTVLPCVHRAPIEKNEQARLLLIC
jgi:hypothetical protein